MTPRLRWSQIRAALCLCDLESSPPGSFTDRVIVVNVFQFHNKSLSAFFLKKNFIPHLKKNAARLTLFHWYKPHLHCLQHTGPVTGRHAAPAAPTWRSQYNESSDQWKQA